jgi:hypothetical protein
VYKYRFTLSLTSALIWGDRSMTRPVGFTPRRDPVPIVQEAGRAPWLVWTTVEYLAPTRIRPPDHPAIASRYVNRRGINSISAISGQISVCLKGTKRLMPRRETIVVYADNYIKYIHI